MAEDRRQTTDDRPRTGADVPQPAADPLGASDFGRSPVAAPGRIMALDLGDARIGIALSDEGRRIAAPFGVIRRKSRAEDYDRYGRLIAEQRVTLVVVGLPITMAGHEGDRAIWARDYAAGLSERLDVPVVLWDERMTTVEAEAALRARGRRGKKLRAEVDAAAAALILQSYLDHLGEQARETHP